MMHDPETLASAYLDGELTDEERRVAEADPAVMAEVEQLRALRAGIADVAPPSDSAREAAIGAAMAAFHDRLAEPSSPASAPVSSAESSRDAVVVPMWKRFASPQWLGGAAAALVLVVGVGVVATRTGDDDDSLDVASDDATSEIIAADDAGDEPADARDAEADRMAESEMADETFAASAADEAADDMDMATEMAEEPAEEVAEDDAGDDMADESVDDAASDADAGVLDGPPPLDDPALHFEREVPIVGPRQLSAAASYLLAQRDDGELGPTPEYRCEFYNVLGTALFDVDGNGDVREVLLEIDEAGRIVYAVERDRCLVVATVDLDER